MNMLFVCLCICLRQTKAFRFVVLTRVMTIWLIYSGDMEILFQVMISNLVI